MKTVLSCLAILLLCTLCLVAGDDFCDDSSADTKIITKSLFNKEKDVFKTAYSWFKGRTAHTDMSSDAELTTLANDLITYVNEEIRNPNISFIVVRSTGAIIIDITQSPPIYPNIENHNTRYTTPIPCTLPSTASIYIYINILYYIPSSNWLMTCSPQI